VAGAIDTSVATNDYLQSKDGADTLQSKRRPSIGSSIGATEGEGDKAPLVFPLKKKNKRLQARRIMLELAAHGFINMSPEPESDEAPLVFPLKKKNKRMQAKNIMLELAAHGLLGIPPEPAVADADVDTPGACVLLPARVHRVRRVGMPIGRYAQLVTFIIVAYFPAMVFGAGFTDSGSKVPTFSGDRVAFTSWFIVFSAYVAWKLTDAADILAGQAKPTVPAPILVPAGTPPGTPGPAGTEPPGTPAPGSVSIVT
jgi:hypothetical protein